jgi:type II secretory pathway pseudopilin PulG
MVTRLLAILLFLSTVSFAGMTDDVREALARNNAAAAEAELQAYRSRQGITPDYLEALSWMARASLASHQPDQADTYAKQTESLSRQMLAKRPLDAEPHLPIALGAALEVQAQVLSAPAQRRDLPEYFHPRPAAEESECSRARGTARPSAQDCVVPGTETRSSVPA